MTRLSHVLLLSLGAALLFGCGEQEEEEDPFGDEGPPPGPDACNSEQDALSVPECELTLGLARTEFIGLPFDRDWFSVKLPGGLTGRSLLHVSGGYSSAATSVQLSLNVLKQGGGSVATAVDAHGQGAPKPIDVVTRFSESNARLLLFLQDDRGGQHYDHRNPYQLMVEVVDDPDGNEPNDETPTPIPLAQQAGRLYGKQTGVLATPDDVDRFKLSLPSGRKVLHVRVSGPALTPALPLRVAYTLFDAGNKPVAEGRMDNEFLAVDLATARSVTGGDYVLEVKGYRPDLAKHVVGDLRRTYVVEAQLLDELDVNEPNGTLETAKTQAFGAPGASATLRGRLGTVPDADWFAFDLPATSRPTVLHYKLTPGQEAGRFPVLPGPLDRQVRIFTEVKDGATVADRQANCKNKASVCPRRSDAPIDQVGLVESYCALTPPRCMWSAREENARFQNLKNFEGALPVAPHSTTVRYFVVVEDEGNNWADDKEYTLTVNWRDDADEAGRMSGGVEQTQSRTLAVDDAASGFPSPPSGGSFELTGKLSYGYGFWRNNDALKGQGLRGPDDYDVTSSDSDRYELVFPAGLAAPLDRTWELQWEVEHAPGGRRPYDITLDVEFCDGDASTSSCSPVRRTLGYKGGDLGAWHSAGKTGVTFQPVYSLEQLSDRTRITGLAWGCFCFEPRFVKGGKFYIRVQAVDREGYEDATYRIRTAITAYPKPYNGGMCPAPDGTATGGCQFAR